MHGARIDRASKIRTGLTWKRVLGAVAILCVLVEIGYRQQCEFTVLANSKIASSIAGTFRKDCKQAMHASPETYKQVQKIVPGQSKEVLPSCRLQILIWDRSISEILAGDVPPTWCNPMRIFHTCSWNLGPPSVFQMWWCRSMSKCFSRVGLFRCLKRQLGFAANCSPFCNQKTSIEPYSFSAHNVLFLDQHMCVKWMKWNGPCFHFWTCHDFFMQNLGQNHWPLKTIVLSTDVSLRSDYIQIVNASYLWEVLFSPTTFGTVSRERWQEDDDSVVTWEGMSRPTSWHGFLNRVTQLFTNCAGAHEVLGETFCPVSHLPATCRASYHQRLVGRYWN